MNGVTFRKKSSRPVIGFCGWAGFDSKIRFLKYAVKNALIDLKKIATFDSSKEVYKQGLYFRRKAIRVIRSAGAGGPRSSIVPNIIIRKTFSGNAKTISLPAEQARREYIDNIVNSDFVLAPKGDANYSVRFFEALSLGRIPILIDTDVCLPLEDVIDYSKCILRVNYKDIKKLPEIASDFYAKISADEFIQMQKNAREIFEKYIRYDSFFNIALDRVVSRYKAEENKALNT